MARREVSTDMCRALALVAAAFMLLPVPVMQFVGEEGLMAIKSYEMFVRHDWLHPSILGGVWPHSPLWHWPVIALCRVIGWEHVDVAMRLVSVISSWLTALVAFWGARRLFGRVHPDAGWLAALVCLSMGEISFWYGWLGYVDAMFGMFIFAATMALWVAVEDEHPGWLLASALLISLAFMTKNITAYGFYGATGLVLVWRMRRWRMLRLPWFWAVMAVAVFVPWAWQQWIVPRGQSTTATTLADAWRNFAGFGAWAYVKHWISYPFVFVFRALPVSLFVIWLHVTGRSRFAWREPLVSLAWILLLWLAPFWLSAGGSPRYLVPLYGLAALLLTGLLLQLDGKRLRQGVLLMALMVALKLPYSLAVLPWLKDWRPERDVRQVAMEIKRITNGHRLLTENDVSTGLAIAAYLDVWRPGQPPVVWNDRKTQAFVLAEMPTPALGRLVRSWRLRGDHVYLYWQEGTGR